jgi:hypothetical protein
MPHIHIGHLRLRISLFYLAEGVGIEPTQPFGRHGLANRPINHSSNLPINKDLNSTSYHKYASFRHVLQIDLYLQ